MKVIGPARTKQIPSLVRVKQQIRTIPSIADAFKLIRRQERRVTRTTGLDDGIGVGAIRPESEITDSRTMQLTRPPIGSSRIRILIILVPLVHLVVDL